MQHKKVKIAADIFQKYPNFTRGIIFVKDIQNKERDKRIKKPLNKVIEQLNTQQSVIKDHSFLKSWDEAHRVFGSDPVKYPPSINALLARIERGGGFPFINSVVALFNLISLKYLIPCGGDDLAKIEGNLCLDFARGNEIFTSLGSTEIENPNPGEVIYYDDKSNQIMCRRWNWRNAEFSKISIDSKNIVINIDGIGDVPQSTVIKARDELANLLQIHCQAILETEIITKNVLEISLPA